MHSVLTKCHNGARIPMPSLFRAEAPNHTFVRPFRNPKLTVFCIIIRTNQGTRANLVKPAKVASDANVRAGARKSANRSL